MSWKSTVYLKDNIHVWTEPNFNDYEEEKTVIYIGNQAAEMIVDQSDEVSFLLESPEGQAVYDAFSKLREIESEQQEKEVKVYSFNPYCGSCEAMPRLVFNGEQFDCKKCGWTSNYNQGFINRYKSKVEAEILEESEEQ